MIGHSQQVNLPVGTSHIISEATLQLSRSPALGRFSGSAISDRPRAGCCTLRIFKLD